MVRLLPTVRSFYSGGIIASLALAGCGLSTTEIDASQAEKFVKGAFAKPPRSVKCPSGVEAKEGGTLTCKAVDSTGKRYDVVLHMSDDQGHVTVGQKDFRPVAPPGG